MHPVIYIQTLPTWFKLWCYAQISLRFHPSSLTFVVPRILKVYHVFLLIISANLNILLTEACSFCQQFLSINSTEWGRTHTHTHTHNMFKYIYPFKESLIIYLFIFLLFSLLHFLFCLNKFVVINTTHHKASDIINTVLGWSLRRGNGEISFTH